MTLICILALIFMICSFNKYTLELSISDGQIVTLEYGVDNEMFLPISDWVSEELTPNLYEQHLNNIFIKVIPLFLKNIIVRLSYLEIRKYSTITYSNILYRSLS